MQLKSMDVGTRVDMAMHQIHVAREDLDTVYLTFNVGQFRGAFYIVSKDVTE